MALKAIKKITEAPLGRGGPRRGRRKDERRARWASVGGALSGTGRDAARLQRDKQSENEGHDGAEWSENEPFQSSGQAALDVLCRHYWANSESSRLVTFAAVCGGHHWCVGETGVGASGDKAGPGPWGHCINTT